MIAPLSFWRISWIRSNPDTWPMSACLRRLFEDTHRFRGTCSAMGHVAQLDPPVLAFRHHPWRTATGCLLYRSRPPDIALHHQLRLDPVPFWIYQCSSSETTLLPCIVSRLTDAFAIWTVATSHLKVAVVWLWS